MAIYDLIADKLFVQLEEENKVIDLSNEFNQIKFDWEKVKFAEKIWHESKIEADVPFRVPKNKEKSKQLRTEGNTYFSLKNKNYFKALELYNESICFAENDTEDIGIGYANRSAIYFEWKKYELCVENINLAKQNGYPDRLMDKLNKRETECIKQLNSSRDDDDSENGTDENILLTPKLTYPPHPDVPFIANCLQMCEDEQYGRYIVTTKKLKVGQVVAIEDGFCTLVLPGVRYQRCANCLNECNLSLIPCKCCTSAMFCSDECLEQAQKNFHKYECPIIDFMFKMLNIIQLSAVRVSLCAITSFDTVSSLLDFTQDPNNKEINAFTLKYTENMPASELYKPIHTLETNQEKRATPDLFQRAVISAVLYRALLDSTSLGELLISDDEIHLLMELLFRHLQTASTNFHRLETLANVKESYLDVNLDDHSYGSGAYAFCSLINHSCSPNIVRLSLGKRNAVFVLRPIDVGEQLLDNYGYHHSHEGLEIRQKNLLLQYKFQCKCLPCQHNYPIFTELKQAKIPTLLKESDIKHITNLDKTFARDNFSRFCTYLTKYGDHYPCSQLSSVEECLKMCLHLLVGNIPLSRELT